MRFLSFSRKDRLIYTFSIYIFVSLFLLSLIFFFTFRWLLFSNVKKDIYAVSKEIIEYHIAVENGQLIFKKDSRGISLQDKLTLKNTSAVFFDKKGRFLRAYGVFDVFYSANKEEVKNIYVLVGNTLRSRNVVVDKELKWQGAGLYVVSIPIISQDKIYGVLIAGRDIQGLEEFSESLFLAVESFIFLIFLLSFWLSRKLVNKSFAPINEFLDKVSGIDLDNLHNKLKVEGVENDEFVILAKKFNEMLDRLEYMSRHQKEFIDNVAHELKTPLSRVISTLELLSLERNVKPDKIKGVVKELFHINQIIEDLLIFSRQYRTDRLEKGKTDVKKTVEEVLESFKQVLQEKKVNLVKKYDRSVFLDIPEKYFKVVFRNIFDNAVKYSPEGSKIIIEIYEKKGRKGFRVIDEGIGINKATLKKIYERFYREKEARVLAGGYGIGLSLVKKICDMYSLQLEIKSKRGKGTEVKVEVFS